MRIFVDGKERDATLEEEAEDADLRRRIKSDIEVSKAVKSPHDRLVAALIEKNLITIADIEAKK